MRARTMLAALALLACASAAAATAAAGTPELGHFLDKARGIEDWLVSTRRLLHTIPELFYEVRRPVRAVALQLAGAMQRWLQCSAGAAGSCCFDSHIGSWMLS